MKFGVWVIPPSTGFWAGLPPRFQMFNTGKIVIYDTREEAQAYADICMQEKTRTWSYEVREINEH